MAVQAILWAQPGKNHDPDKVSLETATDLTGIESVTVQSFGPATEIDNIMKRFYATGEMPRARKLAEYGDFDESLTLTDLLEQLSVGAQAFSQIPASIRGQFNNDPGEFLEWIHDERNHAEAVDMGLLPRPVAPVVAAAAVPAAAPVSGDSGEPVVSK